MWIINFFQKNTLKRPPSVRDDHAWMIHPNVYIFSFYEFLAGLQQCAEKAAVCVAVFVAGNTYVCFFGSDGAAALLSACSLNCPLLQSSVCLPLS